ncbi:MAG: DUF4012 domain-containing protein [Lachnospiraceae bacterium]|uniref:DUF4012 domain-containing protein n=1 Tax=Candidatus Weimeria bifida TaxID=2599074 RepID=A0A6N7J2H0_9FIRM|nr:DUF4012 domain-containing protein [Candidatus Weimeria bifida]RRF95912.1 MAG: DUF4012 domain-containing protein [Lachnospiraceae bacterium]
MNNFENSNKRKASGHRRKAVRIVIICLIVLICLVGICGVMALQSAKKMKPRVRNISTEMKAAVSDLKQGKADDAVSKLTNASQESKEISTEMQGPVWKVMELVPGIGKQIKSARTAIGLVGETDNKVLLPFAKLAKKYPMTALKTENGFNAKLLVAYMNFAEQVRPEVDKISEKMDTVDVSMLGIGDKVASYKKKISKLNNNLDTYLPLFKTIVGNGSDRRYLLIAQNLAEGRSIGGFMGSAAEVNVKNGELIIGDFHNASETLPSGRIPENVAETKEEVVLFDGEMRNSWDANYSPDYERAAQIWAACYETQHNTSLNGVLSLNTNIIPNLLKTADKELVLSDGTKVNSSNALQVLSHDLYYKYFNVANASSRSNVKADALFAETATKAQAAFLDGFSIDKTGQYKAFLDDAIKEGTLLGWMKDKKEEKVMISSGVSGKLKDTPESKWTTGFYWNFDPANKMGWFMNLKTSIGQKKKNSDGSVTYEVKGSIENIFDTSKDMTDASSYILGGYHGNLQGQLHLIAPEGASIGNVKTNNGLTLTKASYMGLEDYYGIRVKVAPGKTLEISYTVTLPAGVNHKLRVRETPSVTSYRSE